MKRILLLVVLCLAIPAARATPQSPGSGGNSAEHCTTYTLAKILGVISAGDVGICNIFDSEVPETDSTWELMGRVAGPDNTGGAAITYTWSVITSSGCTVATPTVTSFQNAATSGSDAYALVTMTSTHCTGVWQVVVAAGATTLITWQGAWNTDVAEQHLCGTDLTQCTTPSISNSLSGTVGVSQSGSWAVTLSGTTHQVIDSWPSLTAAVTNSGTINVVNSGSQSFSVTSWPTLMQKIISGNQTVCLVTATGGCGTAVNLNEINSGSLAVTNSGGQTIAVSSWPQLHEAIDTWPALTVHQDQACGATITCKTNSTTTIGGNATAITNVAAFDWSKFTVNYMPVFLTIGLVVVFFVKRDPVFGIIASAAIFYTAFAYSWAGVVITVAVLVGLYIVVAMLLLRKQKGGLSIA